ncbi:MAG: hypothetical protein WBA43_09730 [Elainellaceae cyanobacterium]
MHDPKDSAQAMGRMPEPYRIVPVERLGLLKWSIRRAGSDRPRHGRS